MSTAVLTITRDEPSSGGFTPETELLTTRGPVRVDSLSVGDRVYALSGPTKLAKPKFVKRIEKAPFKGPLIELAGKRLDFRLHPTHHILFATKARQRPRYRRAENLTEQEYYRFVNEWKTPNGPRVDSIDITDFVNEFEARAAIAVHGNTFRAALPDGCEPSYVNSHTGYHFDSTTFKRYQSEIESAADEISVRRGWKQQTQPYLFAGDDFVELLGWFITEGSVFWRKKRTAEIQLAQQTPRHRRRIEALLDRMGFRHSVGDCEFRFSSELFGILLESLCGSSSQTKRLPAFVWRLAAAQQRLLLKTLLRGDGNDDGVYYTTSDQLAADVLRLCVEVGVKPGYARRGAMWRIFTTSGQHRFRSSLNVSTVDVETSLYRVVVEDYASVLAGRNGRFQWVGASGVC